jgi:hypothetical protein
MKPPRKRPTRAELRAKPVEFTPSYHENDAIEPCPTCAPNRALELRAAVDALAIDGLTPEIVLPDCDDCGNVRLVYVQREKSTP